MNNNIKLCDFGISILNKDKDSINRKGTQEGTLIYLSPEIIKNNLYSNQSDIW